MFDFYGRPLNSIVFESWYGTLKTLENSAFIKGVHTAIAQSKFLPSAQEIFELARQYPAENSTAYAAFLEQETFTDEELTANRRKLHEMIKKVGTVRRKNGRRG